MEAKEGIVEFVNQVLRAELTAVHQYLLHGAHCVKVGDFTTRHMLEDMIQGSEEHVDWLETQSRASKQVGIGNYLAEQIKKDKA